jgi:hypothetical protein
MGPQGAARKKAGSFTANAFSSGKLSQAVSSVRSPLAIKSLAAICSSLVMFVFLIR